MDGTTFLGTFAVQRVEIGTQNDREGYFDITCHFAQGSETKGCRIIIAQSDQLEEESDKNCELTVSKEETTIAFRLPKGNYTISVYDYEDTVLGNAAFNTSITIPTSGSSHIKALGMNHGVCIIDYIYNCAHYSTAFFIIMIININYCSLLF